MRMIKDMNVVTQIVAPGRRSGTVLSSSGAELVIPEGWRFLAAGDSGLTRKVKSMGVHWQEQIKRGRRIFAQGVWTSGENIERAKAEVAATRATPQCKKKKEGDRRRRDTKQQHYVGEFHTAIVDFLDFASVHGIIAEKIAHAVATHATPIGSGTVARTTRIPIEKRAEAAVIAWMRHQTTGYDKMQIARVKGKRREVRRDLAHMSLGLLSSYRQGEPTVENCPLLLALKNMEISSSRQER